MGMKRYNEPQSLFLIQNEISQWWGARNEWKTSRGRDVVLAVIVVRVERPPFIPNQSQTTRGIFFAGGDDFVGAHSKLGIHDQHKKRIQKWSKLAHWYEDEWSQRMVRQSHHSDTPRKLRDKRGLKQVKIEDPSVDLEERILFPEGWV